MIGAPLVVLRDVHKRFGAFAAVRGVSLDVTQGQVLCLIGASGSGKTTLLRCINQLVPIDGGGIWLDGELLGQRIVGGRRRALGESEIADNKITLKNMKTGEQETVSRNIIAGRIKS